LLDTNRPVGGSSLLYRKEKEAADFAALCAGFAQIFLNIKYREERL
jgi:hypothetical protein